MNHNFQASIEMLASAGYGVLQIMYGGSYHYFYIYEWHCADETNAPYHMAIGINITNFLEVNHGNVARVEFLARFDEHIRKSELMRVEFCKEAVWWKWNSYTPGAKR